RAALFGVERAEFAELIADVGVVDMLVADVIGSVAVQTLADDIGKIADGREVGRLIEADGVLIIQALPRFHFVVDIHQVPPDITLGPRTGTVGWLRLEGSHQNRPYSGGL